MTTPFVICRHCVIVAAMFLATLAIALDEVPPPKEGWNIIAECQMIVLPQKTAWPLIPDLNDDEKIDAAWGKLQQMIEKGDATLIANLFCRGRAGDRLVIDSTRELHFAAQFYPLELPDLPPGKHGAEALRLWPLVGSPPDYFETHHLGQSLELAANVSADGQWIAASLAVSHERLLQYSRIDGGVMRSGDRLSVEQPEFTTLKNTIALQIRNGQRVLIGVHKIPGEDSNIELFFFCIRSQHTGPAK